MSEGILHASKVLGEKIALVTALYANAHGTDFIEMAKSIASFPFGNIFHTVNVCVPLLDTWYTSFRDEDPVACALMAFLCAWQDYFDQGVDDGNECERLCKILPQSIFGVTVDEYVHKTPFTFNYWNLYECVLTGIKDSEMKWPNTLRVLQNFTKGSDIALQVATAEQMVYIYQKEDDGLFGNSQDYHRQDLMLKCNTWKIGENGLPMLSHKKIVTLFKMLRSRNNSSELLAYADNFKMGDCAVNMSVRDALRRNNLNTTAESRDNAQHHLERFMVMLKAWTINSSPKYQEFKQIFHICTTALEMFFDNNIETKSLYSFGADNCYVWGTFAKLRVAIEMRDIYLQFFTELQAEIHRRIETVLESRKKYMYLEDFVHRITTNQTPYLKCYYSECPELFYPAVIRETLRLTGPCFSYVDPWEQYMCLYDADLLLSLDPIYQARKVMIKTRREMFQLFAYTTYKNLLHNVQTNSLSSSSSLSSVSSLCPLSSISTTICLNEDISAILTKLTSADKTWNVHILNHEWIAYMYTNINVPLVVLDTFVQAMLTQIFNI